MDNYTPDILKKRFIGFKEYTKSLDPIIELGVKARRPNFPEDMSENIIKFIIQNKLGDKTSRWNCEGDLLSEKEGIQECKCFTSAGPSSFSPNPKWDIIYFLDATKWQEDKFILYRVGLKAKSDQWKNIKVNKTMTFNTQCMQGRRPRINWKYLKPQIEEFCTLVYEGTFEGIFTPAIEEPAD